MSSRAVEVAKGVPPLAPEREVIWPKRTKVKLSNGLQVILAESHSIPKFHGQLIFLSGNAAATDRAPGLAEMTATVVRTGTQKRASRQIEEDLRSIGADLSTEAGSDISAISFTGLSEFAEPLLDLVQELAREASFPESEFERERRQKIEEVKLDRTQPGLPMKKGRCGTMTHDYKRNGTTTLFAALEVLEGKVVGQCFQRHRHQEFLRFLRRLDQEFSGETALHLVMDNYGTHKHPNVKAWMKKHPRFIPHFVPTSSSWLNLVERWFGELTAKRVRRGSFGSVQELRGAIAEFLETWNEKPKPFVWTATVDSIQEKLTRCRQTLEQIQPGCTLPRRRKKKK